MEENKKLEFRGGSFMALIPFAIFIIITIALSFFNAADQNMMIGAGVIGLLVGMFFAKNLGEYWDVVLEGLGSKVAMTAVMLWLVVGIYGNILNRGQIVEGLVWLSVKINVSGAAFTVAAFIFAAVFAMATGSGFGTISTMSFILYPAGILLGSNPAVLAGAILSGAAVGDNLAPVSDTAIIASSSQEYMHKDGVADIGSTVRTRAKFVLIAGVIAAVLFFVFGGAGEATDAAEAAALLKEYQNPKGLLLLIPTILVIILAVKGVNIFAALGTGIVAAAAIGIAAGLFPLSALFSLKDGKAVGAIPEGVAGMTTVSIVLILVVAMGNMLVKSGCMDTIVDWMNEKVIKTPRGAEVAIWLLATIFGILIAAINTIANICVAPFVNAVGKKNGLHPYRRTEILATTICSFPFFLPFGGCVLLLLGGVSSMMDTYPFLPELGASDMMFTTFYSWAIWIVMFIVCIIGWGRSFEGKNGEYVLAKERKEEK
ncbi:Malate-2H(+)/Na(+)-lactate antiporter [uncultured Clostridium sp.]|jgi:Na+/H+ antiporter NhaC|nr:sodium:proton antiporter [Ruminococcus sp. AF18-22]SCI42147.1 Malate-2H(+)/Na(+)-lactate antiporter [uncultured Clostridium sp.]